MWKKSTALALLLALIGGSTAFAEKARNPFELPATSENRYHYEQAIQKVLVQGIVQSYSTEHVIIRIKDIDGLAVLKNGESFALDYQGVQHTFKVGEIGGKSVWFQAPPPLKNPNQRGKRFEVFIR